MSNPNDGLNVRAKADGTWLEFVAADGRSAVLRVETLAEGRPGLVGGALRQWCRDHQATRDEEQ